MSKWVDRQFADVAVPLLAWQTAGLDDWPTLVAAVCALLMGMIDCDEVVWSGVDETHRRVTIHTQGGDPYDPTIEQLILDLDDYPLKNHYLGPRRSRSPARLGDVVSDGQLRATRSWADLLRPNGVTRQLTIPTAANIQGTALSDWTFNRNGSDFSDDDLSRAAVLQPLLRALERSATWQPDPADAARFGQGLWVQRPEVRPSLTDGDRTGEILTPREQEVLVLVARGLTATAIGHRLRISSATVRKHLEHIYRKIGQHDRLLAVYHAQRSGLLDRPPDSVP